MALALAIAALAALWYINHNMWALMVLPVVVVTSFYNLRLPRLRWVFYFYYPAHLAGLRLIRIEMGKAGYLFFT